ncbi:HAD family hydrolase [Halobacteria archaeon AArc-dxtr1]|nr:HAD family hydrolase [Halobacteria archaeon AArc-dxtr1]
MTTQIVLCDLDNTFYPYAPCNEAGKRAAWQAARERGYDLDRDAFEERYQAGRRETKREIEATAASHERMLYAKRGFEQFDDDVSYGDVRAIGEAYWTGYRAEMELFPDVAETLAELQDRGVAIAVVTNLTTRVQLAKIETLELDPHIDLVVTSEEVGREKPASVMFTTALARLDGRVSEAVMIGDNVEADIAGANAVGIETVLYNADSDGPLEGVREPDHQIPDFSDLLAVVE